MADVNQVVTLGIGTPSDITHFLTFGLSIGDALEVVIGEIALEASYAPSLALTAGYTPSLAMTGNHVPSLTLTGSVEG